MPPGEYDWTVRLQQRCGLMSNYFDHLLSSSSSSSSSSSLSSLFTCWTIVTEGCSRADVVLSSIVPSVIVNCSVFGLRQPNTTSPAVQRYLYTFHEMLATAQDLGLRVGFTGSYTVRTRNRKLTKWYGSSRQLTQLSYLIIILCEYEHAGDSNNPLLSHQLWCDLSHHSVFFFPFCQSRKLLNRRDTGTFSYIVPPFHLSKYCQNIGGALCSTPQRLADARY